MASKTHSRDCPAWLYLVHPLFPPIYLMLWFVDFFSLWLQKLMTSLPWRNVLSGATWIWLRINGLLFPFKSESWVESTVPCNQSWAGSSLGVQEGREWSPSLQAALGHQQMSGSAHHMWMQQSAPRTCPAGSPAAPWASSPSICWTWRFAGLSQSHVGNEIITNVRD